MSRRLLAIAVATAITGAVYLALRSPASPDAVSDARRVRPPTPTRIRTLPELRVALAGSNTLEREQALVAAAALDDVDVVHLLAEIAGSRDRLANRAAAALGAVRSQAAGGVLAELAAGDGPVIVRANAARALAAAGPEHAGTLARLVRDARQPVRVRQEAALALATLGGPDEIPLLVDALGDEDAQLRISIVQALGAIDDAAARQALRQHALVSSGTERAFVARALRSVQR